MKARSFFVLCSLLIVSLLLTTVANASIEQTSPVFESGLHSVLPSSIENLDTYATVQFNWTLTTNVRETYEKEINSMEIKFWTIPYVTQYMTYVLPSLTIYPNLSYEYITSYRYEDLSDRDSGTHTEYLEKFNHEDIPNFDSNWFVDFLYDVYHAIDPVNPHYLRIIVHAPPPCVIPNPFGGCFLEGISYFHGKYWIYGNGIEDWGDTKSGTATINMDGEWHQIEQLSNPGPKHTGGTVTKTSPTFSSPNQDIELRMSGSYLEARSKNVAPIESFYFQEYTPSIQEGEEFLGSGLFYDNEIATLSGTVDYGDGSGEQTLVLDQVLNNFDLVHLYTDDGIYTVSVCITVNSPLPICNTLQVTVSNITPEVEIVLETSSVFVEGDTYEGFGWFSDPGADAWSATIDYGDGSVVQLSSLLEKTFNMSHTYLDHGDYDVMVCVKDDEFAEGCDTQVATVNHPQPVLDTLDPDSVVTSPVDLPLTVNGSSFVEGSVVRWNEVDLATTYISGSQLTATVPAGNLEKIKTAQIAVFNPAPGGGTSNIMALFVTKTATDVVEQIAASGTDPVAMIAPVKATAVGDGLLVVAEYDAFPAPAPDDFPAPVPAFSPTAIFDVYAAPAMASPFTEVTIETCKLNGGDKLFWWDDAVQKWQKASQQIYDPITGCITLSVTGNSSPSLSQLQGTFFVTGNTVPTANSGGPYMGAINALISFTSSGSSDPDGDPLTYNWVFGDDATSTDVMPAYSYTEAGIYNVCLTVKDGALNSEEACTIAVVYDPSAGFVTGGGWIDSPAGAYVADPTLAGKANFGFISKYQKGASVPTGNTEFQFQTAGINFHSNSYEWLVVTGSNYARYKGVGTINGEGVFKFMLWAGDGTRIGGADTFRIKIWTEDQFGAETVVYDNGMDQAISSGSIIIHN